MPVSELKYCVFTFSPNFSSPGMNRPKLMGVMLQLQSFEELFKDFQHSFPELHLQYPAQLWVTLVLSYHSQGVRSEAFSCSTVPFMPQGWGRCFCPAAACGYREHHWGRRGSWLMTWLLLSLLLNGSHVQAARTKSNWCPQFFSSLSLSCILVPKSR